VKTGNKTCDNSELPRHETWQIDSIFFVFLYPFDESLPDRLDVFICKLKLKAKIEQFHQVNEVLVVLLVGEFTVEKNWAQIECPERPSVSGACSLVAFNITILGCKTSPKSSDNIPRPISETRQNGHTPGAYKPGR
jgi:hypothetical protein